MKCNEPLRMLTKDVSQKGSHIKLKHDEKEGIIIFPNHGSPEMATGTANSILKKAGLK